MNGSKGWASTISLLVVFSGLLTQKAAASEVPAPTAAREACNTNCGCLHRLRKLKTKIEATLATAERKLTTNAEAAASLAAAATSGTSEDAKKFGPLAASALATAAEAAAIYSANAPKLRHFLKTLNHLEAGYTIAMKIQGTSEKAKMTGGGNHYSTATFTDGQLTRPPLAACAVASNEDKKEVSLAVLNSKQKFKEPTMHTAVDLGCHKDTNTACNGATAQDIIRAQLKYTEAATAQHSAQRTNNAALATAIADKLPLDLSTEDEKDKNTTLAVAAVQALEALPDLSTGPAYDTEANMKALVARIALGIPAEQKLSDSNDQEIKTKIKELYGENYGDFAAKIWNKLPDTTVTYFTATETKTEKLKALSNPEGIATAIGAGLAKAATLQMQTKCPTQSTTTEQKDKPEEPAKTADECKKHKTSEDCKKGGCEFDDKKDPKCFPKAETEKKDEKSFSRNLRVSVS
uniref:Variant surface glycoprotein 1188 n=1 Tax=Trypanosoma brucei TaxID=5691 RepID=M4SXV8_9TRYP|nr:variant surface glycoprotein 1188 [Trypanosoma brucei]